VKRTLLCLALALSAACSHDPLEGLVPGTGPAVTDDDLKTLIRSDIGVWRYFANATTPIARASSSPHPETLLRVRYNTLASTQLDANGRVKPGAVFPDSSVVVKELYTGSAITTLAVMMKLNNSSSAGFGGWIWAEYTPSGTVRYSTTGRGGACSNCHSSGIDYTRMNDTHP
jgi:hypothetical protein